MTIESVKKFYRGKENHPCPLTDKLVKAGYQQKKGGYIARAISENVMVDYKKNCPSQYWHLMTYCNSKKDHDLFTKSIVCGELIFWMAEVSGYISTTELEKLVDRIIQNTIGFYEGRPTYDRRKWNAEIQRICFDAICQAVEVK